MNYEKDKNPEIFILIKVKSKTAEFDFILAASEYPPPFKHHSQAQLIMLISRYLVSIINSCCYHLKLS